MKRQVDYNKIASNISKYSFSFDLTVDETYENFSKEYPEIYNKIIQIYEDDAPSPFFIGDTESTDSLLVQDVARYGTNNLKNKIEFRTSRLLNVGEIYFQLFEYDFTKDIFKFTNTLEEYASLDNLKSVFNQSITGTGNITLFRHKLKISDMSSTGVRDIILDYLSTSNLVVDNLQDLAILLNVSRNDTSDTSFLGYLGVKNYSITYKYINGIFELSDGTNHYNANAVSDKVTAI